MPAKTLSPAEIKRFEAEAEKFAAEAGKFAAEGARLAAEGEIFHWEAEKRKAEAEEARMEADKKAKKLLEDRAANSERRVLDFVDTVSKMTAENAIQKLSQWARLSKDPITIRFNSPGGSVIDGLGLFDYILTLRASGIRVVTATLGMAASMACILLQAGDKRVMGQNALILIHEVASGTIGKVSEMEDETKFAKELNRRLYKILSERAGKKMSVAAIERRAKRKDWWLMPEEAKKLGFCDEIGYAG